MIIKMSTVEFPNRKSRVESSIYAKADL